MNDTIDSELQKDFEWFISYWVGRSLHESKFGKIGLRWKMTKTWNSRIAHAGIPGRVRDVLGEENATRLFQDISDQIINDPAKAAQAKDDFISFGHHRTDDVKTEINDSASSASSADAKRYLSSKGVTDSIADIAVLSAIISTLTENDLGHELYNYENNLFTSVRGYGTIFGNRLPLRMESIFGGYDPMKCQTDEFVDLIDIVNEELKHGSIHYEHIPDPEIDESELSSAKHVLSDLASLQNGGKLVSFVETIIYYNSNIDKPIMGDDLIQLLKKREDDKQIILKRLDMYSFDDTTNSVSQGSQTAPHVSSSPKSGMWQLPPLDLLDDVPTGSIKKSGVVPLKTVLKSDAFTKSDQPLTFALGATNEGTFATVGLKMMGAVLAAGQTGSGKSTFTETTLLLSLLYKYNPDELKLLLIDPKVVQFPQYQGIPHLLRPVITEPDAAREAFDWVLSELQRRTESPDENHPYIVIVIDEVSDLMAIDKQFYEHAFSTIANSADKTGIHLYMGTSRPSTDIYTDKLRQGIGGRIVFTTASEIDSITMLEQAGAEQLGGYGEMLFKPYRGSETIKIQTPYASDEDTMRVTEFWRNQGKI